MASRKGTDYVKAYRTLFAHYKTLGVKPQVQRLDNETSAALTNYLRDEEDVKMEYVPPDNHRTNKSERAIRDVKNHSVATFATADPNCPFDLWDESIEQGNITINLLRPYGPDPTKSAYQGMHKKEFDFNAHPIAPWGTQVLIFDGPNKRESWATHGQPGFYMGPALNHYRCYRTICTKTGRPRIADTLEWLTQPYRVPGSSSIEIMQTLLQDIKSAFATIIDNHMLPQGDIQAALHAKDSLTQALSEVTQLYHPTDDTPCTNTEPPPEIALEQRVDAPTEMAREQRVDAPTEAHENQDNISQDTGAQMDPVNTHADQLADSGSMAAWVNKLAIPIQPTQSKKNRACPSPNQQHAQGFKAYMCNLAEQAETTPRDTRKCVAYMAQYNTEHPVYFNPDPAHIESLPQAIRDVATVIYGTTDTHTANNATLNLDEHGKKLTYASAMKGPNRTHWQQATAEEFTRLFKSGTMKPMHKHDQPKDRAKDTTYYNPQTKEKINMEDTKTYRVRGTAGGDKINYPGEVAAATADMETVKILIQSVPSDQKNGIDAEWMTLDIKDYYLGAPLERPEYIRVHRRFIPEETMKQYNLYDYLDNDTILFEITKCMYGLPQAGFLSQQRLIKHLSKHGYIQDTHVPCLFKHANGTVFSLVVDDFGVKYPNKAAALQLIQALEELYKLHVDWQGEKYLGFRIKFKRAHSATLDMPTYIPKALAYFFPNQDITGELSPATYHSPNYGAKQQLTSEDTSAALNPAGIKRVQEIVGSLLYYSRAIDSTMLPATTAVSSQQAKPTDNVLKTAEDILHYAAAYPNNKLVLYACDMHLFIQSDASYLSRQGAGSVAGGVFYLGDKDKPEVINGPILAASNLISVVVAAVSEAEYGACFQNAQLGVWLRTILQALGYAQPPTPIQCDNECAVGLANGTLKAKKSKSIDMRFHWVRDRVKQHQFIVYWKEGKANLADFFTKPLPIHEHQRIMKYLVQTEEAPRNINNKRVRRSTAFWAQKTRETERENRTKFPHEMSEAGPTTHRHWAQ